MKQKVTLLDMFPDYDPPDELYEAFLAGEVVAADIDPQTRSVNER